MIQRHAPAPSKVLGEIQMMFVAELVGHPTTSTIAFDRRYVVILQAALGELIGQIETLEEGSAAADRLTEEMAILRADRERWKLAAETYHSAWGREVDRTICPMPLTPHRAEMGRRECGRRGEVVDLTEALRRERRDAGRPIGPEGGAA